ncbi:hypothetical protein A0128_02000 [Leptospira tipperaryensis]|uniref:DUF1554 domain-containing protein n=1 Tax=Leptospira tipperaryensis TaxID=2564040 RepID=A0A1D7UT11_9LEPT|nr:DUF1554 domain-containing protein [Leptospira tipperaryensis]AOP32750.1 hypothetical protein A0128_02000 [Leptospira tipperaryensis]
MINRLALSYGLEIRGTFVFLRLILFCAIFSFLFFSCTVWPVLTVAATKNSERSDSSASVAFLALVQGGDSSVGSTNTSSTPVETSNTCAATGCSIFLTVAFTGNMGGIVGADSSCATAASGRSAPGNTSGYKALLMTDDGTRDLTNSWVLYPNTTYQSLDNSNLPIGTTNGAGQLPTTLANEITGSGGNLVYTGMNTTGPSWAPKTGTNCLNWTTASNSVSGWFGSSNAPNSEFDAGGARTCDVFLALYCVQR